eukprot:PITA_19492
MYPLPKIDDLLDQLPQAKYFTKLDLKFGYHQVQVKEEDPYKTAFKTREDLYEWLVMQFGLCDASAKFMSVTWEEHISHLTQALETLKKHHLLANLKECEFAQQYLVYLGYVIGGGQLKIDPANMEAIMKWFVPTNVSIVRSFVAATQYLRKFITSFSTVAALLHAITTSGKTFQWGKGQ